MLVKFFTGFFRPEKIGLWVDDSAASILHPRSIDFKSNRASAASGTSALPGLDGDVASFFEPLEKLGGLIRAGDILTVHTRNSNAVPQSHLGKDAAGSYIRELKSGGLAALLER